MKKNIFTHLAKKKSLIVCVAMTLLVALTSVVLSACQCGKKKKPVTPPDPPTPTYEVSFETNGGSAVETVTVEENSTLNLEDYVTTKENNYFYGWCLDEALTLRASAVITVTENMKLYAEWGAEELYWLHFETGLGSDVASVQYTPNAYLATPEEPTRENYAFGGWYKDEDCTREFPFFGAQMPKNNLTVYAKWNALQGIVFETNGGSKVESIFGQMGEPVDEPLPPTKTGFIFEGWYSDKGLTKAFDVEIIPESIVTVYAKWHEQIKDIQITLHLNHDAVSKTTATVTGNEGEVLNADTTVENFLDVINEALKDLYLGNASDLESKSIYNFSAWAFDSIGSKRFDGVLPHKETLDLYAIWSRSAAYCQVSFAGETDCYFVKKNTAIPETVIDPVLSVAKAEYEEKGCTVDGFYTVGGNRYQKNDLVAMDMDLIPYIYSANLEYVETTKMNAKGVQVKGYALKGYKASVADEYKAKESLLLLVPEYYNDKPIIWIDDSAFADFPVNEISLPKSILGIGAETFKNTKLTEISLPDALYYLGDNAFSGSTALATISFKSEISQIGVTVFDHTAYEADMSSKATNGFVFFDAAKTVIYRYVGTASVVATPGDASIICGGAFKGNTTLKTLTLDDDVRYVGDYAFAESKLQTVNLGKFFANMGKGIFKDCTALTTVSFLSKYNLSYLGESMFEGCSALKTINVAELQNLQKVEKSAFKGCAALTDVAFSNSLTTLGESAFENCTGLVYADFGTSDVSKFAKLSNRAFAGCSSLRRIILRGELINNQPVSFGANVLLNAGYTKNSTFVTPVVYVKDKWVDNWSVDDDFKSASYVQIYQNKFKNTEYKNIVIKAIDDKVPSVTVNGAVELSVSGTPNISAFDLLSFLTSQNVYTVSDNVSTSADCFVYIDSVMTASGSLVASTNGKYNLSVAGTYYAKLIAEDEFGNVGEALVTVTVKS